MNIEATESDSRICNTKLNRVALLSKSNKAEVAHILGMERNDNFIDNVKKEYFPNKGSDICNESLAGYMSKQHPCA